MPPTMILIGVCACAGAASRGEAAIAAKMAAARILRMGRPSDFWAFIEALPGAEVPSGEGLCSLFEGHEAFHAMRCQPGIWGVRRVGAGLLRIPSTLSTVAGRRHSRAGWFLGEIAFGNAVRSSCMESFLKIRFPQLGFIF